MRFLSDKELKDFSSKFVFPEWVNGYTKKRSLSLKKTSKIVESFVLPRKDLEKHVRASFSKTRVKFLRLCLNSQTPNGRWEKCRRFLLGRLETQVIADNVEHSLVFDNTMDPNSFISQCIKVVVFFNAIDKGINLPEGVILRFSHPDVIPPKMPPDYKPPPLSFPNHYFERYGTTLKAYADDRGIIAEKYINKLYPHVWVELNKNYKVLSSILIDTVMGKKYFIPHEKFYGMFHERYPDIAKTYKLNPNKKPYEILSILNEDTQKTFLQKLTQSQISKWKWEKDPIIRWDSKQIIKDHFPDLEGKVNSIGLQSIGYKPNNPLLNEELLRYELADLYLEKLNLYERKEILLGLARKLRDFSVFRLKAFRDLIDEWEGNKGLRRNILTLIRQLKVCYPEAAKNSKEYKKMVQCVKIAELIIGGCKPMEAYKKVAAPSDKVETIAKRYERLRKELKEVGFDLENQGDIQKIKRKWEIPYIILNDSL